LIILDLETQVYFPVFLFFHFFEFNSTSAPIFCTGLAGIELKHKDVRAGAVSAGKYREEGRYWGRALHCRALFLEENAIFSYFPA